MDPTKTLLERQVANLRLEIRVLLAIVALLAVATVALLFLGPKDEAPAVFLTALVQKASAGLSALLSSALVVRVFSRRAQIATMTYLKDSVGKLEVLEAGEKQWVLETVRAYVRKGALAAVGGGSDD